MKHSCLFRFVDKSLSKRHEAAEALHLDIQNFNKNLLITFLPKLNYTGSYFWSDPLVCGVLQCEINPVNLVRFATSSSVGCGLTNATTLLKTGDAVTHRFVEKWTKSEDIFRLGSQPANMQHLKHIRVYFIVCM